tara:strand:- start:5676 stop:6839 length:1164 start_codon:yes stop_codon:yes gene_type:complete
MKYSRFITIAAIFVAFSALVHAEADNNIRFNLAVEAGYIDNFLYQTRDQQSTAYYTLSSDLALTSKMQQSAFDFDANVTGHFFEQFENDQHTNFTLKPKYQFKFSQNQGFYITALWLNRYVYRGEGLSLGEAKSLSEGDEKKNVGVHAGYEYGTTASQAKLSVNVAYDEGEFTTRRDFTSKLDTEVLSINSSFDYLLSGKTYLAFDIDYKTIEYPNEPLINRDSLTGLVGIKWSTTVISELSFLLGYQKLKFEDSRLSDDDAFKWQFDYTWRPSDFTQMHVVSDRQFDESNRLLSRYRLAQRYQIDLAHAVTEQLTVFVAVGLNQEQFFTAINRQEEDYISSTLQLNYQYNDRLSLQASYNYQSLEANYRDIDYRYNRLGLSVSVEL